MLCVRFIAFLVYFQSEMAALAGATTKLVVVNLFSFPLFISISSLFLKWRICLMNFSVFQLYKRLRWRDPYGMQN